jgi:hypothetical protein
MQDAIFARAPRFTRNFIAGLCTGVAALILEACLSIVSAAEVADTPKIESAAAGQPVATSAATEAAPAAPQAAAAPAAADAPRLTTFQRLFGTFKPYEGYGDGPQYSYQLVEKDGQKLYCQQETITSTRVSKKGVCLTMAEMQAREETRRRNAEQFLRQGESSRTQAPSADSSGGRYNDAMGGNNTPAR